VSIWREATNKLAQVTSPELSKDISSVHCMEPLSDLVIAVGCEGGRVVILKLLAQPLDSEPSQIPQILSPTGTAHDDKKQIIKVRHSYPSQQHRKHRNQNSSLLLNWVQCCCFWSLRHAVSRERERDMRCTQFRCDAQWHKPGHDNAWHDIRRQNLVRA
jgi:hypothetical protein